MAELGAGAPAVPFEILGPRLEQFAFRHRFVRGLDRDQDFHNLQFRKSANVFVNHSALHQLRFEF
jgi:hypothetical protein